MTKIFCDIADIKLINKFAQMYPSYKIKAVLAGKKKSDTDIILNNTLLFNTVEYTHYDYVDDSKLIDLYTESNFLIFLSNNEGFGLPVLEAISFGCIPILSNIDVFKEIINFKNYPFFIFNDDYEKLCHTINQFLDNDNMKQDLFTSLRKIYNSNRKNFELCGKELNKLL